MDERIIASRMFDMGYIRIELEKDQTSPTWPIYRVNIAGPHGKVTVYRSEIMDCARYLMRLLDRIDEDEEKEEAAEAVSA